MLDASYYWIFWLFSVHTSTSLYAHFIYKERDFWKYKDIIYVYIYIFGYVKIEYIKIY